MIIVHVRLLVILVICVNKIRRVGFGKILFKRCTNIFVIKYFCAIKIESGSTTNEIIAQY